MKFTKALIFCFFATLFSVYGQAQDVSINGKVIDENGLPIPGASILIKGTSNSTATDFDGNYQIKASSSGTLVFSYLGYTSIQEAINGRKNITVKLKPATQSLEEVVVVGYGTQKITKVSGAISTVKAADIEKQKPLRVEEALQGRASGVSVIQNGSPGSKPTVLIRGIPSFSGTSPTVIIDGVPQTLDDLSAINSADIESLNVLKDASATAIYGIKGGNGVIVVTTKSGKRDQKVEITFNTYGGQQEVIKKIGVLNATEYGAIINESSAASGGPVIFPDLSTLGYGTNWQDQVFKTAGISSHNLTARGGGEKMSYFLSAGYLTQDGIVGGGDKSNFNRINLTSNLNFELSSKLKLVLNTSYVNIKNQGIAENSFNSVLGSALNFDPTVSVYNTIPNTIGTYGFSNLLKSEIFNPLTKLANTYNESNGNKLYGKIELQYDLFKNMKLTSRFGYTKYDQVGKSFTPLVFYGPLNTENTLNADGTTVTGKHNSVNEFSNSNFDFTQENFANYNFNINDSHNFDIVAGVSFSRSSGYGFNASREDVRDNSWAWADISAATGVNTAGTYTASTFVDGVYTPSTFVPGNTIGQIGSSYQNLTRKNASYFGRINYDYNDKYLASFSARRDGSIAFGTKNKFANFYAGSMGWVVSKEEFFNSDFISLLKIRGSYGTTGNENVSPQYVSISTGGPSYNQTANSNGYTFGGTFTPGATVNSFANDVLRWEKQTQFNVGFDLSVLNNLSLTADYFDKKVDGLLFIDAPPLMAGTSEPVASNIGTTQSKGVDMMLSYSNSLAKIFKFNSSLTFTTSTNLVTATNNDGTALINGGFYFNGLSQYPTRFEKGFSPGYFYGFQTAGLFQSFDEIAASPTQTGAQPGDIKYVDVNGDGKITDLDKTKIGDPFPKFTMGWNIGAEYKNFDLSVFTYASVGNDVYRAYERNAQYSNKFRNILDRWTGQGTTNDANNPRVTFSDTNSNARVSDRYVEDGSFVKIKNVVLGYTIPSLWYQEKVFSKVRIYAQVKNLVTLTKYTGFDPEVPGGILDTGVDRGNYPQARTILAGLDLKF